MRDPVGQLLGPCCWAPVGRLGLARGSSRGHRGRGSVQALGSDVVGHRVRYEIADRPAGRRALAHQRSTRCRAAACRRSRSARGPAERARRRRSTASRSMPSRAATATVASSSTRSGSCQSASARGLVGAEDQHQLVAGRRSRISAQGVGRVGRALAVDLERATRRSRSSPATASSHSCDAHLGARVAARSRGAAPGPPAHHHARRGPSCRVRLLGADQVAQVRRVEGTAEDSDAQAAYSLTWPEPSTTNL